MIDGAVFRESLKTSAVPAVFLDGQEFGNGRMTIQDILTNWEALKMLLNLMIKTLMMF